ncbi:Receptor-like kinase [Quillaja saponaria]|uniref:non-specific serine/threonine protein kinase n=1 Tax=Quillaja saponaria TaxID=32244 RepID=A0AAD7LCK0_QUISA|nr:Receptor-like kinase [Quillaja saponaria]
MEMVSCVNGTLASWLFGNRSMPTLTWEQRMQISIGIAKGLWVFHKNPVEKMVHGNIKTTNILLNEKLEAKIAGSISSNLKWKKMYGLEANLEDVFSFGIVLMQILAGRNTRTLVGEARGAILTGNAWGAILTGNVSSMADPCLNGAYIQSEI